MKELKVTFSYDDDTENYIMTLSSILVDNNTVTTSKKFDTRGELEHYRDEFDKNPDFWELAECYQFSRLGIISYIHFW